ncbi:MULTISPECIES: hypothetical protein [unclassified Streptomyces]|uniref:hypothetical protein n=1 Tax=unclassified Streptomyces TaxID=2593676 RepID=UPI00369011D5
MMILAGGWWVSGALWQFAITTITGIAVGVLGAVATLRASHPKRLLSWQVHSNKPLDSWNSAGPPPPDSVPAIAVTFLGTPLAKPRIIELSIENRGRLDITSDMFHGGRPMEFDFGVDVCAVLDLTTAPGGSVKPEIETGTWMVVGTRTSGDSWLHLKPSLLSGQQKVTFTLLVDGDEKPVQLLAAPLVNVRVSGTGTPPDDDRG